MPSATVTVVDTEYIKNVINGLNADYDNLAYDFDNAIQRFYEFICDESQLPVDDITANPTRLLTRHVHDNILAAHRCGTSLELSPLFFNSFSPKRFTTVAKYPASLFRDAKVAVTIDIMVHALHAIWSYSSESNLDFRQLATRSCSHIPAYFISCFRHTMQLSPVTPIAPSLSRKAAVGVSTFGASVMGESYLRVMIPDLTDVVRSDNSALSDTEDTEEPENFPIMALSSAARRHFSTPSRRSIPGRTSSQHLSEDCFEKLTTKQVAVSRSPSSKSLRAFTSNSRPLKKSSSDAEGPIKGESSRLDVPPLSPTPSHTKKRQHASNRARSYKKGRTSAGPARQEAQRLSDAEREDWDDNEEEDEEEKDEEREEEMGREADGHPDTSPITKRVPGHFSPRRARV